MRQIKIYTDGSCNPNPGAGGWGYAIFEDGKEVVERFGGDLETTNNKMELMAAVMALKALESRTEITIYTDSQYVRKGITSWIRGWKRNGWKTSTRQPVKNQELWQELDEASTKHIVTWKWVKGHSGNAGNELADQLANKGRDSVLNGNKPTGRPVRIENDALSRCLELIKKLNNIELELLSDACRASITYREGKN